MNSVYTSLVKTLMGQLATIANYYADKPRASTTTICAGIGNNGGNRRRLSFALVFEFVVVTFLRPVPVFVEDNRALFQLVSHKTDTGSIDEID